MTDQTERSELLAQGQALAAQGEALARQADELPEHGTGWAEWDLTADQEIRARALDAAVRTLDGADLFGPPGDEPTVRDFEQTTIGTADRYAEWIATGDYDWLAPDRPGIDAPSKVDP